MNYDVDYFIDKFEKIPEEMWCAGAFNNNGAHCANGHCNIKRESDRSVEANGLASVFSVLKVRYKNYDGTMGDIEANSHGCNWGSPLAAAINDGEIFQYQQPTPKQRILAALRDIKKMQSKEKGVQECDARDDDSSKHPDPIKKVYIYKSVEVSEEIKEMEKMLN